jgi:ABC-type transport system substrate-binding protein
VADKEDIKPSPSTLGRPPFTSAPEASLPAPELPEIADQEESTSDDKSVSVRLTPKTNPPNPTQPQNTSASSMANSTQSLKIVTEPLSDTNFTTWRYKIINALGYYKLDDYVLEDSDELKSRPEYKDKKKQATTYIRLHLDEENANRFVGND